MGSSSKVILLYDQPYWRHHGFSGETLSDCVETPVFNAYDDCRAKDNGQIQPAFLVFINAQVDRQWSGNRQASQKIIVQTLSRYFNDEKMLLPKSIHWKVWNEQQSLGGAPISLFPTGVLSKIDNIRKPKGNIHWAGTEMATVSQGYMDGAIQSGKRCGDQILKKLQKDQPIIETKSDDNLKFFSKVITQRKQYFEWW